MTTLPEVLSHAFLEAWYLLTGLGGGDWAERREAGEGGGKDAERLDKAYESGGYGCRDQRSRLSKVEALVELLPSKTRIEAFEERIHPWADDPKTVGALAGTQLAIQASLAGQGSPGAREEIFEAGAIPPLVGFLRSNETDRVHAAVVALRFLTADCPSGTTAAYEAGALKLLLQHVGSPPPGKRAAAATALRNICMEKDEYRAEFVELGGLVGLVQQLSMGGPTDLALPHADVQLEAILNLQDLIEDPDGNAIDSYARRARDAGAARPLRQLALSESEEVRASAREVLALLGECAADAPEAGRCTIN